MQYILCNEMCAIAYIVRFNCHFVKFVFDKVSVTICCKPLRNGLSTGYYVPIMPAIVGK